MTTKKVPISFNTEDLRAINELIVLMGISGTYGDFPKAIKFGVNLALSCIKNDIKVYSGLNDDNLKIYFNSVFNYSIRQKNLKKAMKYHEIAQKVEPSTFE